MYDAFRAIAKDIQSKLDLAPDVKQVFDACFLFTLDEIIDQEDITRAIQEEGMAFIKTGDIPAMWLRDSAAQVRPYVPFAKYDDDLAKMIKAVIRQQGQFILHEPYSNAFNQSVEDAPFEPNDVPQIASVWERKFELDSLCYPLQLCQDYWQATGDKSVFTDEWRDVIQVILDTMQIEQYHDSKSDYFFERDTQIPTEMLRNNPTQYTGMVWSGFRPSDDSCEFNYLIPSNIFAVMVLTYVIEWAENIFQSDSLHEQARKLCSEIQMGIETYAIIEHPQFGKLYAYEVDGYGNHNVMDDANIPSLLSIPYMGYCAHDNEIYQNTRRFILTAEKEGGNSFYYSGDKAEGIGSPHTPKNHIWHMALIMQALTTHDEHEQTALVQMIVDTTSRKNLMHESIHSIHVAQFDRLDSSTYTREEFGWANSLFAELILRLHGLFLTSIA